MSDNGSTTNSNGLLARLQPQDRERLGEAMRRLMAHGSILGLEPSQTDLYHWCYQNRPWMDDFANLLDFYRIPWEYEPRSFPIQWDRNGKVLEDGTEERIVRELDEAEIRNEDFGMEVFSTRSPRLPRINDNDISIRPGQQNALPGKELEDSRRVFGKYRDKGSD